MYKHYIAVLPSSNGD